MNYVDPNKIDDLLRYHASQPMLFNSGLFLLLFAGFLIVYNLLRYAPRLRIGFVVLFSIYFYYKSSGWYFLLMLATSLVVHYLTLHIYTSRNRTHRKWLLTLSIVLCLSLLGWFKYANFLSAIAFDTAGLAITLPKIFLPLGISFYTFELISYAVDAHRRLFKPVRRIADFFFYVSFFPHLVAGPIVRPSELLPQLQKKLTIANDAVGRGVFLIVCGLVKKAIISDYISSNFVDRIFDNPTLYTGIENLLGIYGYTLQIYCDFSGYSDMAIGLALLLGFHLPDNFHAPYQATSLTDFWRRWHISLSSWLRDYLYIPLGGNRVAPWRQLLNLFLTMLLGGLWHGAAWKYILWGALHGLWLVLEKLLSKIHLITYSPIKNALGWLITFHIVAFSWIFFRAENLSTAMDMLVQIQQNFQPQLFFAIISNYYTVFALIALGYALHFTPRRFDGWVQANLVASPVLVKALILTLAIWLVIQTKSSEMQPFIYFQF